MERHPGPGKAKHAKVVGPVANRDAIGQGQAKSSGNLAQSLHLGFAAKDRLGNAAGQVAIGDHQRVGAVFVKAQGRGYGCGKGREAAGDEGGIGPMCLHRGKQRLAARHKADATGQHGSDGRGGQAFQQGNALAQGAWEIQLAIHRAPGDGCDLRADAGHIRQLVNTFLCDHR